MSFQARFMVEMSSQNRRPLDVTSGKSEITQTKAAQHLKRIDSIGQADPPGTGPTSLP